MNHCPDTGTWRSYLDQEQPDHQAATLTEHLATCPTCLSTCVRLRQAADDCQQLLKPLQVAPGPVATQAAWQRLATRLPDPAPSLSWHERITIMWTRLTAGPARLALSGSLTALVVALVLALTPAGSMALQSLSVFRIQTFKAITFEYDQATLPRPDPNRVPPVRKPGEKPATPAEKPNIGQARERLEKELAAIGVALNSNVSDKTAREVADLAAAQAAAPSGTRLQTITSLPGPLATSKAKVYLADPTKSTVTIDLSRFRQAIRDRVKDAPRGAPPIDPDKLPGISPNVSSVGATLQTAFSVVQIYGQDDQRLLFAQGPSPELTLTEGIDIRALRDAILASPGLAKKTRDQITAIKDEELTRTLIIPVPAGTIVEDVTIGGVAGIGGVPGLLLLDKDGREGVVLWQKGGTLYAVAGYYGRDLLLAAANSAR